MSEAGVHVGSSIGFAVSSAGPRPDGSSSDLAALTAETRRVIAATATSSRSVKANVYIVREADTDRHLHVISRGWACRSKTMRDGSRQIVTMLVPGDVANTAALLPKRADYAVRSLSPVEVISCAADDLLNVAKASTGVAEALMRMALLENSLLSQSVLRLGRHSARQRLAHLLCELATRVRAEGTGSCTFELPVTQEQIADTLGLTSVHTNRMFQQLRGDGLVSTSGRMVTLPNFTRLAAEAEFNASYLDRGDDCSALADT